MKFRDVRICSEACKLQMKMFTMVKSFCEISLRPCAEVLSMTITAPSLMTVGSRLGKLDANVVQHAPLPTRSRVSGINTIADGQ